MTATGLPVFDTTVQETNIWLKAMMGHLRSEDRHLAYQGMRATLHALRDRIGPPNAVHLAAQLPMLLRGLFFEGWRMVDTPSKERNLAAFLEHVRAGLPQGSGIDVNMAARATFAVLRERLDPGETAKLKGLLPEEIAALFDWDRP